MSLYGTDETIEKLLGRKLKSISKDEQGNLRIEMQDGDVAVIGVEGECCSSSWIEEVAFPDYYDLDGATLKTVEDADGGQVEHPLHDCLRTYYRRFKTDKADVLVTWYNASNGYYGGYWVNVVKP